jgi:hypothetical protein
LPPNSQISSIVEFFRILEIVSGLDPIRACRVPAWIQISRQGDFDPTLKKPVKVAKSRLSQIIDEDGFVHLAFIILCQTTDNKSIYLDKRS